MLLTITTTGHSASELGFLLHKHPGKCHTFDLSFGKVHVFYPEASDNRCTAAILLDVDPVALSRKDGPPGSAPLLPYVNDRPYVASSFLSVAISQVLGTALSGRCKDRPELAAVPIHLEAELAVLPCRGGEAVVRRLFEPLGYQVAVESHSQNDSGETTGSLFRVRLTSHRPLSHLLSHLYVLVPVLDDEKHYWVGDAEVEKLLRHGQGWLKEHPERELIAFRYLKHRRNLARSAISRLDEGTDGVEAHLQDSSEDSLEDHLSLREHRVAAVVGALKSEGARRVLDLGCGAGHLLGKLLSDTFFTRAVGMDVSPRALDLASERLDLPRLPDKTRKRVDILHGSLLYRDKRLKGYDGAAVVEVIEHFDPPRLTAFAEVLFRWTNPTVVVLTTPNRDYNVLFSGLAKGALRHRDHRFEWSREEFEKWGASVGQAYGYSVRFEGVGPRDDEVGTPTQMAIFRKGG